MPKHAVSLDDKYALDESRQLLDIDHTDWRWDERVLQTLRWLEGPFGRLGDQLSGCLERFGGYRDRYSSALARAMTGQKAWVDGHDRDSCHTVWIQFHEDLLATLGLPRGSDT